MKRVWMMGFCLLAVIACAQAQDAKQPIPPAQGKVITKPVPLPDSQPPVKATAQVTVLPDPRAGKFKFRKETYDFGEVTEGNPAECEFQFKNTGKKPITIIEAHGSCGCTVPNWPKTPILPKHKGVIHVTYNTTGRVGPIDKDVIITSDALQNPMKLHLVGTVIPKPYVAPDPPPLPPPPAAPVH